MLLAPWPPATALQHIVSMSSGQEEVEPPGDWAITRTISVKCTKMIFRNKATRMFMIASTIGIIFVLGLIFMVSRGEYEAHLTSEVQYSFCSQFPIRY